MNFYIRKNSTLPKISVEVFTDSNNSFRNNYDSFSSSTITLNLIDEGTNSYRYIGIPVIVKESPSTGDGPKQYYLETQLNKKQTKKTGSYVGEFIIEDDKGKTILPINNKLKVFVIDSFSNPDLCCRTNKNEEIIFPTETSKPTQTPTPTLSNTPTNTTTPTLSNTPTNTTTPTLSNTPTNTPTNTTTPTLSNTPTNTTTPTLSNTPTETLTSTPTNTPTETLTSTPTNTPTPTLSNTTTPTLSNTPTETLTSTPTNTPTPTLSNTPSSPETFFILFEDGSIMTSEDVDGIEYEH